MSSSPSRWTPEPQSSPRPTVWRKRSSSRRRMLLLFSLCGFWIYHRIDQRTEDFQQSGRTPGHTEGTLVTADEASGRISYPTVFDHIYDSSPHSRTIAAILPVTTSSLPRLSESLSGLSIIPHLSEVYLLCPEPITNAARHSLRQTLSHAQGFGHTEFFVILWRPELSAAKSALQVAFGIPSSRILILPQDGLTGICSAFRSILLFGPPSLPVPLGLRGLEVSSGMQFQGFLTAPFVSPPLLLPSRMGTANQSYFHLASWEELGAHFTQAEGVGGVVPPATLESASSCYDSDASKTDALELELFGSSPGSLDSNVSLVILMAERDDAPALSKLACEFESRGTGTKIIAYGIPSDVYSATEDCNVTVTHLDPQDPTLDQLFDRSRGVTLTLTEYSPLPEPLLEVMVLETVVRIPRQDLPHCDWVASLGIGELRSERLSKIPLPRVFSTDLDWHIPRVEISVITNDRPNSLQRLLRSLSDSRYFGDNLNIRFNIEQDADYDTLKLVDRWKWEHGSIFVTRRVIHAGLLPAVVESWYPHSNHSYGLILEDDVEVSPLFYGWLKMNLLRYRYGENQNRSGHMFGISLYQPKVIETRPEGRVVFNPRTVFAANGITEYTTPYLSQIPCSWGAVYFPEHWREFHSYLNVRLSEAVFGIDAVVVPDARSNRWSKSWKKYFIELAYLRGYVMVYPNYDNFVSLSTNHLEIGSHVKDTSRESYEQKREKFRVTLMALEGTTRLVDLPHGQLPAFDDLPVLDLFGQLSYLETLILLGKRRQSEIVPVCDSSSEYHIRPDFRDLLCAPPSE